MYTAVFDAVDAWTFLGTARWLAASGARSRDARRGCDCDRDYRPIGRTGCNITFDKVAREWRCKYAADASGGPADSASLKAAEELLQSYLPDAEGSTER